MLNPIDTITLENGDNKYQITLDSVECTNNKQTWTYTVTKLNGKAISNWALELCEDIGKNDVTNINPSTTEIGPPGGGEGNCLNGQNDCESVNNQIKWDSTGGTFKFTLSKCYKCGKVHVAIKTGNLGGGEKCLCGMICGPSCNGDGECNCDVTPPTTRGITFM